MATGAEQLGLFFFFFDYLLSNQFFFSFCGFTLTGSGHIEQAIACWKSKEIDGLKQKHLLVTKKVGLFRLLSLCYPCKAIETNKKIHIFCDGQGNVKLETKYALKWSHVIRLTFTLTTQLYIVTFYVLIHRWKKNASISRIFGKECDGMWISSV